MIRLVFQHLAGLIGQVTAVLPAFLITVALSRSSGLEVAGRFTVLVGISAAVFSAVYWGLRTSILLDRFQTRPAWAFSKFRFLSVFIAAAVTAYLGASTGTGFTLIAIVVLFRMSDAIIDVHFPMQQVWKGEQKALLEFATLHFGKLFVLVAVYAGMQLTGSVDISRGITIAAMVSFVAILVCHLMSLRQHGFGDAGRRVLTEIVLESFWFALAAALCALVTSAPRISLPIIYDGQSMGVVGVSLSVATFFGMIFYTSWVRHISATSAAGQFSNAARRFLAESIALGGFLALLAWTILPELVALLFSYDGDEHIQLTRAVLVAAVVFFAGMNSCNLFKATRKRWLEPVAYATALAATVGIAILYPTVRHMPWLLATAGSMMFMFGLLSFRVVKPNE